MLNKHKVLQELQTIVPQLFFATGQEREIAYKIWRWLLDHPEQAEPLTVFCVSLAGSSMVRTVEYCRHLLKQEDMATVLLQLMAHKYTPIGIKELAVIFLILAE